MRNRRNGSGFKVNASIIHYQVDLVEEDQVLVLNEVIGTLGLLSKSPDLLGEPSDHPYLLAEEQFSSSELSLVKALLHQYPHFCPYEVLLASFYRGVLDDKAIILRYRERLEEAEFAGTWDNEMRPVRNVLSRARFKLSSFGIEVSSILETGYILIRSSKDKRRQ